MEISQDVSQLKMVTTAQKTWDLNAQIWLNVLMRNQSNFFPRKQNLVDHLKTAFKGCFFPQVPKGPYWSGPGNTNQGPAYTKLHKKIHRQVRWKRISAILRTWSWKKNNQWRNYQRWLGYLKLPTGLKKGKERPEQPTGDTLSSHCPARKMTPIDIPSSLINLNFSFSKFYGQMLFQDRKEAFLF